MNPLEPPDGKFQERSDMGIILWLLLLLFGILILLNRSPLHAPPFESLTQYVCDPLPHLPNLGNRAQSYNLKLRCKAGVQVIYQRQSPFDASNPYGLAACKREGGLTTVWRMKLPSPYGAYVFRSTCGGQTIINYKDRAATYQAKQRFTIGVAALIILVSLTALGFRLSRSIQ